MFVIGQNGGEYPVEGKIFGVDPKTGDLKWTFYTTGRDDPEALATWGGNSWKYGGGGSWQPGTVDYENNQILIGTGNPNPDYDFCGADCRDVNADGLRPGDNLYTSSTVALDLETGKLNWYFQEAPSDPYDYDAAPGEYVIFNDDEGRRLVLHPGKNGFNHVHDVATGQPVNVYPDMKNLNWTSGFNMETGQWENMLWPIAGEKTLVCPAIDGGHSWNPGTYSPETGLFYRIANEWCMYLTVNPKEGGAATAGSETRVTEPFAVAFMAADMGRHPSSGRLDPRPPDRARSGQWRHRVGEALRHHPALRPAVDRGRSAVQRYLRRLAGGHGRRDRRSALAVQSRLRHQRRHRLLRGRWQAVHRGSDRPRLARRPRVGHGLPRGQADQLPGRRARRRVRAGLA